MGEANGSAGQLLKLSKCGESDNTIVIFGADNGARTVPYRRDNKYGHGRHTLRDVKRDLYEGGHRVPFIDRWPGRMSPGTTSNALTSQIDIMATLAAVTGSPLTDDMAEDSHNMLPLWTGETVQNPRTHIIITPGKTPMPSRKMAGPSSTLKAVTTAKSQKLGRETKIPRKPRHRNRTVSHQPGYRPTQ